MIARRPRHDYLPADAGDTSYFDYDAAHARAAGLSEVELRLHIGIARWKVWRVLKPRWVVWHAKIEKARAFWRLHDSKVYGSICGDCRKRTLSERRARYNYGMWPKVFRWWYGWYKDKKQWRIQKAQADVFRLQWARSRAMHTIHRNVGQMRRARRARHLFRHSIIYRVFHHFRQIAAAQRRLRTMTLDFRQHAIKRNYFHAWRRHAKESGESAAVEFTVLSLVEAVEFNHTMEQGRAFWRTLALRRYLRAMAEYALVRKQTRAAALMWKRQLFNQWKRLPEVIVWETTYIVKIQTAYRRRLANREFMRRLRIFKLRELTRRENQRKTAVAKANALALVIRFMYTWREKRAIMMEALRVAKARELRAADERRAAAEAEAEKKRKVEEYQEMLYQEYLAKMATRIQSLFRGHQDRITKVLAQQAYVAMERTRQRNAALKVQAAYRRRTARIVRRAVMIQSYYRAYKGRMKAREQRIMVRKQKGRTARVRRLNNFFKAMGKKKYHKRIGRFERLEHWGILQGDPWEATEIREEKRMKRYKVSKPGCVRVLCTEPLNPVCCLLGLAWLQAWLEHKNWISLMGSEREKTIMRWKSAWKARKRRWALWWHQNVTKKLHPSECVPMMAGAFLPSVLCVGPSAL